MLCSAGSARTTCDAPSTAHAAPHSCRGEEDEELTEMGLPQGFGTSKKKR